MSDQGPNPADSGADHSSSERSEESREQSAPREPVEGAPDASRPGAAPRYAQPATPSAPPAPGAVPPAPVYAPPAQSASAPPADPGYGQPGPRYAPPAAPLNYAQPAAPPNYAQPNYAQPNYAQPNYAPQGSALQSPPPVAPPGGYSPYAPYGYVPVSGRKFWALTFLFFIPYVGFLASPIVTICLYVSAKRDQHEVVRGNARWATNWALTVLGCQILAFILIIVGAVIGSQASISYSDETPGIVLAVCGGVLFFLVGIAHLVIAIIGTVQSGVKVFDPRIAIPFIREQR